MRAVFGLVLVLGLGLAGFAVYMVKGQFEQQQVALARERANAAQAVQTVEIYAARRDIGYGEEITPEDVALIQYVRPSLPAGTFATEEELFPAGADMPRAALRPMIANEPVLASKVTEPGQPAGISTMLAPGMRALNINVSNRSGVTGSLRPGDRIDVYWTGNLLGASGSDREFTKLIDSNLLIIAVDESYDPDRTQTTIPRSVTVSVTPQQVATLTQGQATGDLTLSLVGNGDTSLAEVTEVDQRVLTGWQPPVEEVVEAAPEPEPEPERTCSIRTRRGDTVVEVPIPCSN